MREISEISGEGEKIGTAVDWDEDEDWGGVYIVWVDIEEDEVAANGAWPEV